MKIRPLFKWFGSKWQSAKRYPAPLYPTIFESFAGSAGYSLNYVEKNVRIDEINPNLISLWMWLIHDATQSDILAIPIDYPVGYNIKESGLSGGQQLLLKHWQRTNNYGECWTVSPWGNKPGQWTSNTRARVAEEFQAVKHWKWVPSHGMKMGPILSTRPTNSITRTAAKILIIAGLRIPSESYCSTPIRMSLRAKLRVQRQEKFQRILISSVTIDRLHRVGPPMAITTPTSVFVN